MRNMIVLAVLVASAGAGLGDDKVDPDRMRAALERLNAEAATQAAAVDRLRNENEELRKENATLRARLAEALKAVPPEPDAVASDGKVHQGMALAQVNKIYGSPVHESRRDGELVNAVWQVLDGPRGRWVKVLRTIRCDFRGGVVVRWDETEN